MDKKAIGSPTRDFLDLRSRHRAGKYASHCKINYLSLALLATCSTIKTARKTRGCGSNHQSQALKTNAAIDQIECTKVLSSTMCLLLILRIQESIHIFGIRVHGRRFPN